MASSISIHSGQNVAQDNTFPINPQIQEKRSSLFHLKPSSTRFKTFKKGWEFTDEIVGLSSNAMSTIARAGRWISCQAKSALKHTSLHLDLLSVVNIPINITKIPSKIQKIWNSIEWKDREGAVLAAFSFSLFIGNMFDTLTSFVNTVLEVLSHQTVGWISAIAEPLSLALIGLDLALSGKRIYHLFKFHHQFHRDVIKKSQHMQCSTEELQGLVTPFLERNLGIDKTGEPSLLKTKILKRRTSGKVVSQFKNLLTIIKANENQPETKHKEISTRLKTITKLLKKEELTEGISIVSSIIASIAVSLFLTSTASIVSFSLLTVSASIGLALKIYDEFF